MYISHVKFQILIPIFMWYKIYLKQKCILISYSFVITVNIKFENFLKENVTELEPCVDIKQLITVGRYGNMALSKMTCVRMKISFSPKNSTH